MEQIKKLEIVLEKEEKENEKIFEESVWCRKHKFEIQAEVLFNEYEAKRKLIQTIRMKVVEQIIDL